MANFKFGIFANAFKPKTLFWTGAAFLLLSFIGFIRSYSQGQFIFLDLKSFAMFFWGTSFLISSGYFPWNNKANTDTEKTENRKRQLLVMTLEILGIIAFILHIFGLLK